MPFVRILVDWDGRKQASYGRRPSTARHDVPVKHELQDFETPLMAMKAGHGLTQLTSRDRRQLPSMVTAALKR
jgi:hypothetical protein